jgi:hypothetical protein
MSRELVTAVDARGATSRFVLETFEDGGRWTSTLTALDARGSPTADKVAPRFYGLTQEQARRRMLTVLENQYEDVKTDPA